jgi:hypothetical protein
MNTQLTLFPIPEDPEPSKGERPRSHRDDPETSRRAAENLAKSGKHKTQRGATLEAVRRCPGATHAELGRFMGVDWLTPARRLSELEDAGLVRKGEPRVCRVKGTRCVTWWAVEQEESQMEGIPA